MAQSPATNTHYVLAREERERDRETEGGCHVTTEVDGDKVAAARPVRKRGNMHVYFAAFPRVPVITCHLSLSLASLGGRANNVMHPVHPPMQCNYIPLYVMAALAHSWARLRRSPCQDTHPDEGGRSIKSPLLAQSPRNCSFPIMKEGRKAGRRRGY